MKSDSDIRDIVQAIRTIRHMDPSPESEATAIALWRRFSLQTEQEIADDFTERRMVLAMFEKAKPELNK